MAEEKEIVAEINVFITFPKTENKSIQQSHQSDTQHAILYQRFNVPSSNDGAEPTEPSPLE
jgi:hypothetical protein